MNRFRERLTYANVMSTIAVFLALGGVSWAAVTLPRNSVGTAQLKNGAVSERKLAKPVRTKLAKAGATTGAASVGASGPKGDPGPVGPAGPAGPAGPVGGPAQIAPDSLTGAEIKESALLGLQAGEHRSAAITVPAGTNDTVLAVGGILLSAQCTTSGTLTGIVWRVRKITSGGTMRVVIHHVSGTTNDVTTTNLTDGVAFGITMANFAGTVGRSFTVQAVPTGGGEPVTIVATAVTDGSCLVMADATR